MPKRTLTALCLLSALGMGMVTAPTLQAAPRNLAATPLSRTDLPWWRQRLAVKQARLRQGHVDLVWYGDSITQDWELTGPEPWRDFAPVWQRFYGDRNAVDLGFKGDTTAHLLWRIENGEAQGIAPKVAIILIGANNFGRVHWSAEQTMAGVEAIVDALRSRLPQTHLVLLGVLPSIRSPWISESTAALNGMLAARFGHSEDVSYVDVGGLFRRPDGSVDPQAFLDGHLQPPDPPLHPTAQSQARIAAAIEPIVAHWMGDAVHH